MAVAHSSRVIVHLPVVRRQILEVPPELWALIAALTGRQPLARLCAVSQDFYAMFSPFLYSGTSSDPPLTESQSSRLLKILSEVPTSTFKSPVQLIRSLSVPDCWGTKAPQGHGALRKLFEVSARDPAMGSALRTLEWNLATGTNGLGTLLQTPGNFPNLKEVSFKCAKDTRLFDFINIPNLEKMECSLKLDSNWAQPQQERIKKLHALGEALKLSPSSSPLLQTLGLKLWFYSEWTETPVWDAYVDLISTVNGLRYSALTSVEISVDAVENHIPSIHPPPVADISSFLFGHPSLTNVKLKVVGMAIPTGSDNAYLPRLRSFAGSVAHCAAIAARARELQELRVVLPEGRGEDRPALFTSRLYRRNLSPTVTLLKVCAMDAHEDGLVESDRYRRELSPRSFKCLVSAFPNVTRLDITLSEQMSHYQDSFAALLGLERLCIRDNVYVEPGDRSKPAKIIFPIARYAALINTILLPFVAQLSDVHFLLRGERFVDPDTLGCPCCDDEWSAPSEPNLFVEYRFRVNRKDGEAEVVLVWESVVGEGTWPEYEM
ncbi:hypothetical protein C8R44DRAFT_873727 [Mycena epipterygia]|nr:hypothetical protein C8R44DRAFT_873727 [Mycena epipterygia]